MGGLSQKQISADKEENGRNLHQQVYKRVGKQEDIRRALSRSRKEPSRKRPSGVVSLKSPESLVLSVTFSTPPKPKKVTRRISEQIAKEAAEAGRLARKRKNAHKRGPSGFR